MISTPTVLILGAGASVEYEFPAGSDFRNLICKLDHEGFHAELAELGVSRSREFLEAFRWSAYSSPDRFLEDYAEYVNPGKYFIAKVLALREHEGYLGPPDGPNPSWYELLVNKLDLGADSYSDNRLTLISFNYDRSFEHYLWRVINARFINQREQIEAAWNQRPQIIHVHGLLGPYDPLGGSGRPYDRSSTGESLVAAANGIRIIHEVDEHDEVFDAAEKALRGAARIYFLGFGFDERNIDRLRAFREPLAEGVEIAGTRTGIGDRQWSDIVARNESWITSARAFQHTSIHHFLSEQVDL